MSKPQPPAKPAEPSPKPAALSPKPVALSNAERQRRWRERLKAKASGGAVTDHARAVVARAIDALWAYHERPGPGGMRWAEIDGCLTMADYLHDLAADEHGLIAAARAFLPSYEGLTPEEARAITALIELGDVIGLRGHRAEGMMGRLLVAAKQAPPEVLDLETPVVDRVAKAAPEAVQPVRLTAARRARRHGLTQKWK